MSFPSVFLIQESLIGHDLVPSKVCDCVGGVISPLLANIFLHYVLDLWVQQWRRQRARGRVIIVRYADDFVRSCQEVCK
jgi:retron-type reverse transcriptase